MKSDGKEYLKTNVNNEFKFCSFMKKKKKNSSNLKLKKKKKKIQ